MSWRDELSPVKNWQGWLGALLLLAVVALPEAVEQIFFPQEPVRQSLELRP